MGKPPLFLVPSVPKADNAGEILTPEDLERDYKIKLGTQKSMRSRGTIPFVRLGTKLIRYRKSDIEAWLDSKSVAVAR